MDKSQKEHYLLVKSQVKFWGISLIKSKVYVESAFNKLLEHKKTISYCGKISETNKIELDKSRTLSRIHPSVEEAIEYIDFHVEAKKRKGYIMINKMTRAQEIILSEVSTSQESLQSYSTECSMSLSPGWKKIHLNNDQSLAKFNDGMNFEIPRRPPPPQKIFDSSTNINKSGFYVDFVSESDKVKFYKVQIFENYLKIESGYEEDGKPEVEYKRLSTNVEAQNYAMKEILSKISQGFTFALHKFEFDFNRQEIVNNFEKFNTKNYKIEEDKQEVKTESTIDDSRRELSRYFKDESLSTDFKGFAVPTAWRQEDPTGMYMTERLDGIRCFWDGYDLRSSNNKFNAPKALVNDLPQVFLDGMLYMGKGKLMAVHNVIMKNRSVLEEWSKLRFIVYDMPEEGTPFESRLAKLRGLFPKNSDKFFQLAEYTKCESREHLLKEIKNVEEQGGAGVLLKDAKSFYLKGKTKGFFEIKYQIHKEAVIIGYRIDEEDKSKIKSLEVRNIDNGEEFTIYYGITEDLKTKPPPKGTIVLYKYTGEVAEGKPKSPVLVKIKL